MKCSDCKDKFVEFKPLSTCLMSWDGPHGGNEWKLHFSKKDFKILEKFYRNGDYRITVGINGII